MKFEWSDTKNRSNKRKHGVSFEESQTVFGDEHAIMTEDPDHSDDEDRFIMLGLSSRLNVLVVCFCERDENNIRIFSARKANKKESGQYERSMG